MHPSEAVGRPQRLLDFRSGGWVLLIAAGLCAATVVLWVQRLGGQRPTPGDGRNVATYGFDLSTCLVPREELVAAGFAKDGLPAMTDPAVFTPVQAEEFTQQLRAAHQGRFLVDNDRVIGVVVDGVARAYPLRVLTWHEVVNDTVGGRPIVVTYNPLCDSTVVFDRRVAGETLEFGVSGLLYNSNLVMYDRRPEGRGESLWSQLQFRAIAGPAAEQGQTLALVPAVVVHWSDWLTRHPATTVLAPDRDRLRVYQNTYEPYFGSDVLRFPVSPLPPETERRLKTPGVAVRTRGNWHFYFLSDIAAQAAGAGKWDATVDGVSLRCEYRPDPATAWIQADHPASVDVVYAFWFAWYALRSTELPVTP